MLTTGEKNATASRNEVVFHVIHIFFGSFLDLIQVPSLSDIFDSFIMPMLLYFMYILYYESYSLDFGMILPYMAESSESCEKAI